MTRRGAGNRSWHYLFRGKRLTISANRAGNHARTVLLDNAEIGTIERAYFVPNMTTWSIGAPHGSPAEQFSTMRHAAIELAIRATTPPVVMQAPDEIPAFSADIAPAPGSLVAGDDAAWVAS